MSLEKITEKQALQYVRVAVWKKDIKSRCVGDSYTGIIEDLKLILLDDRTGVYDFQVRFMDKEILFYEDSTFPRRNHRVGKKAYEIAINYITIKSDVHKYVQDARKILKKQARNR